MTGVLATQKRSNALTSVLIIDGLANRKRGVARPIRRRLVLGVQNLSGKGVGEIPESKEPDLSAFLRHIHASYSTI